MVEVDETVLTRRKYNKGRTTDEQCIFDSVKRGTSSSSSEAQERQHAVTNFDEKVVVGYNCYF